MSRKIKILASIIIMISSWLIIAIGYTIKIGHPTSTVLFSLGIACFFVGCIWLIKSLKSTKNS